MSNEPLASNPATGNAYRAITGKAWKKARPFQALFELTYRCNHICTFCSNPLTRHSEELSTEEVFRVLAEMKQLGVLYVTLTGGEPLLRPDFWEIAEEARRLKFAIRVFTNAYLIDDEVADRLKALDVVEMSISIHGSTPEIHEVLTRIPGSHQRVLDAVKRLRDRDMRVVLKTPITQHNENDLFGIKAIANELDALMVFDTTITPRFDGDLSPLALAPTEEFYEWFWGPKGAPLRQGVEPAPTGHAGRDELPGACGTGRSGLMVDPYGAVFPCALWYRKLGDVREQSLVDIWDTSEMLKEVRQISEDIQTDVIPKQEDGAFMKWCPATAESVTGDARQLYRPAMMNAKYMKKAWVDNGGDLVQIQGFGSSEPAAQEQD